MTGFPTVNFGEAERGLFSPIEIQRLMRIEYDRAVRYDYPFALMLIEVDRLEYLHDLYGYESKEEILQAVIGLLRSITRASDVLGCMQDDRVMAVFPHTSGDSVASLAQRILRGCRELEFESDGRALRATLSVGVSSSHESEPPSFERFVRTAEEALDFAVQGGGDRFVQRKVAKDLLDGLRDELEDEKKRLRQVPAPMPAVPDPAPAPETMRKPAPRPRIPSVEDLPKGPLRDRLRRLFHALGEGSPELKRLEGEVLKLAETSLRDVRDDSHKELESHGQRVDVLERQINKLKSLLDDAEIELRETAVRKGVQKGVPSVYRTVQGLNREDTSYDLKREMLTLIFEANVGLQKRGT